MKKEIRRYRTVLHGQEVEVVVYEPATAEDMEFPQGVGTPEDVDCDLPDDDTPDLYEELTDSNRLWKNAAEEDE